MKNHIDMISLSKDDRIDALGKIGYKVNKKGFVVDEETGEEVICKYTNKKVHIDSAAILPGSVLVINANPLTISEYLLEYGYE